MSLTVFYMDDFSDYGAAPAANAVCKPLMLEGLFAEVDSAYSIALDPNGTGLPCLKAFQPGSNVCSIAPTEGSSTSYNIAARFYLSALSNPISLISVCPSTLGSIQFYTPRLTCDAGGYLHIMGSTSTGTIYASSLVPVINALGWYHIELYFALTGTSSGAPIYSWRAWVEGVEVTFDVTSATFNYTNGPDTSNLAVIGLFTSDSGNGTYYAKDFIIGVSSDGGNTKIGTKFVTTAEPVADVALGGWVPSTGTTGYPILATNPPGAPYVAASSAGVPETYQCSLSSLPANVSSVLAVMSVVRGQKTDGGDATMTVTAVSGASHTDGAARPFTAQANNYYDVFSVDPATSAPWSKAAVNAMNLKMARTV